MGADEISAMQATVIGLLVHTQLPLPAAEILARLTAAGATPAKVVAAIAELKAARLLEADGGGLALASAAHLAFVRWHARVGRVVDDLHERPELEACPSIPWLTAVQTEWIEAISLNYRVAPKALQALLPAPFRPEIARGTGWVQILMSSLQDLRPQGLGALFGVSFYQVTYRAAVTFEARRGETWRGGYFLRSETNNALMRTIGNYLTEFKFHAFGGAHMLLAREGSKLVASVESRTQPGGDLVGIFDVDGGTVPPKTSVLASLDDLRYPLIDCYDALAAGAAYIYVLSIDRSPWDARFLRVDDLFSAYFSTGPLAGAAAFDSAFHIPRSAYRWQALRRLPHASATQPE